jgi:hydrogenase 3 maturation protease
LSWEVELKKWLQKCSKLAILGIGNSLRGDDALGLEVLKLLHGNVPKRVKLIESGTVPENFTGEVEQFKPSHVLLIDAASLEAKPGAVKLVPSQDIAGLAISTHALPLSMFAEVVQSSVKTRILLLGVQPKRVDFIEGLTPEVEKATKEVARRLISLLREACR